MKSKKNLMEDLAKKLNKLCYDYILENNLHIKKIVIEPEQIEITEFCNKNEHGFNHIIYNMDIRTHLKELQDG